MQEQLPGDAAVERTGMYSQGELRSKRGCPGVQRVQKACVDQPLYSLLAVTDYGFAIRGQTGQAFHMLSNYTEGIEHSVSAHTIKTSATVFSAH